MKRFAAFLALAVAVALPLAAPAAKHKASPAPDASTMPMSSATMPACPATDPVVWVNTSTKVYHAQGTSYFGTTKHGKYACTSAAVAMGAHPSGTSAKSKGAASDASPSPMPGGKKKHKKNSAMMASPTPAP